MRAALALALLVAACDGEPACELAEGDAPAAVHRLGCESDREQMSTDRQDAVFAHTRSINVLIDREDGNKVYFIDTDLFELHYAFAAEFLDKPGLTPVGTHDEFNILNYRRAERRFLLAKIVEYVDQELVTFELSAGDTADADMIVDGYDRVAAVVDLGRELRYRPVSSDQEGLLGELEDRIPTIATDEVFRGQLYQPLNPGVGYGVLRFRSTATLSGMPLSPTDLVVFDRVPNDVSLVAGIITAEFQTPLAHVGLLAKTRGTPNMALRDAWDEPRLRDLEGELVRIEVGPQDFDIEIADPEEAAVYWESLRPEGIQVPVHDSMSTPIVAVPLADVNAAVRIGNKAANLAELYRVTTGDGVPIPLLDQPFAIPFAHYAAHVAASGVQPALDAVIAEHEAGQLDPAELERRLFAIRWTIYTTPVDDALLDYVTALAGTRWAADTRLRVRSSTNVEDLAEFTGAGLYTSAAVRIEDGRDALANALKVVWASVWNAQAFVERAFYRVDQAEVRMGLLMHPAQNDELANGVALTINEFNERRPAYYLNSQIGDISVTNPTGGAVPEQVLYYTWYEEPEYEVITRSSLLDWTVDWPTATSVLTDDEMLELGDYLGAIHLRFQALYPGNAVDVEWKLMPDRSILIKQARPFKSR